MQLRLRTFKIRIYRPTLREMFNNKSLIFWTHEQHNYLETVSKTENTREKRTVSDNLFNNLQVRAQKLTIVKTLTTKSCSAINTNTSRWY